MNDRRRAVLLAVMALVAVELVRTAWISDDAAITLRTVLNLLHGFGARFNVDERVQAYTHPLWFLLLAGATFVARNVYAATFALSIGLSLAVAWLVVTRVARSFASGLLAVAVLVLSKAYVDFSTSGLENPLAHLLIVIAVLTATAAMAEPIASHWTRAFLLTGSLMYLCRPDLPLVILPLVIAVVARHRHTPGAIGGALALAAIPALAWTLFSTLYYGFPLPNTAYAKLGAGIPAGELARQGLTYLSDSVRRDPLTLIVIGSGVVLGVWRRGVDAAIAAGSVIYLAYVISIGGDFMSGRFLTAPLLASTILLARGIQGRIQLRVAAALVILPGAIGLPHTLLSGATYAGDATPANGIVDERGYYYQRYGLIAPGRRLPQRTWELNERRVTITCGNLGFDGISGGPGLHLIDRCALADPLLARLPAESTASWRIGHFFRQLPTDYEESVARDGNVLADPVTREYYRSLRLITRGRLFSGARLREVVRMNLGQVPRPDWEMYKETRIPETSRGDSRQ